MFSLYDVIIIGAGPAGLFAGCHLNSNLKCLIIERKQKPGIKLLMSGAGQCNLTHAGNIKDFTKHYGENGKKIRQILYKYNNETVKKYFKERHIEIFEREDGKIFPKSLEAKDVLDALLEHCKEKGVKIQYNDTVQDIIYNKDENYFNLTTEKRTYQTKHLLVAAGGKSYPTTGSDGSIFDILKSLNISINKLKPALTPIYIKDYAYGHLSGLSFENAKTDVFRNNKKLASITGDVLFTHKNLSGPGILNISRYVEKGDKLTIDYYNKKTKDDVIIDLKNKLTTVKYQFNTMIKEYFELPKRYVDTIFNITSIDGNKKASQVSQKELKEIINRIMSDELWVEELGGYNVAMATAGGVDLEDVDLKCLSSKKYKNLYFAGEVLDVDGDTGGYNIQFALSSGALCAKSINQSGY